MTPLLTAKQDGSSTNEWLKVDELCDAPAVGSWYGEFDQAMASSLTSILLDLFAINEDTSHAIEEWAEFARLSAEWKQETMHLSSPSMIAEHRAYQEIIGMGKAAIPLILQDLQKTKAQWFWALSSITRHSPVRTEDRGDIEAMTIAWLNWGKQRRYI